MLSWCFMVLSDVFVRWFTMSCDAMMLRFHNIVQWSDALILFFLQPVAAAHAVGLAALKAGGLRSAQVRQGGP